MLQHYDEINDHIQRLKTFLSRPGAIYATGGGILAYFVTNALANSITYHNFVLTFLASMTAGMTVFGLIAASQVTGHSTTNPPAKPYNISPDTTYGIVKDSLATKYFGDKKWHHESGSLETLTLIYSAKMLIEDQNKKKEDQGTLQLKILIERVGSIAGVTLTYEVVNGTPSYHTKELSEQTTAYIDALLKATEQTTKG